MNKEQYLEEACHYLEERVTSKDKDESNPQCKVMASLIKQIKELIPDVLLELNRENLGFNKYNKLITLTKKIKRME